MKLPNSISIHNLEQKEYKGYYSTLNPEEQAVVTHYLHNFCNGSFEEYKDEVDDIIDNNVHFKLPGLGRT